jgi:hypothetical protein
MSESKQEPKIQRAAAVRALMSSCDRATLEGLAIKLAEQVDSADGLVLALHTTLRNVCALLATGNLDAARWLLTKTISIPLPGIDFKAVRAVTYEDGRHG